MRQMGHRPENAPEERSTPGPWVLRHASDHASEVIGRRAKNQPSLL